VSGIDLEILKEFPNGVRGGRREPMTAVHRRRPSAEKTALCCIADKEVTDGGDDRRP
jgi:hypothetical protein